MALAKLPDMSGINELKKEYFPHLFNRMENQSVVSDILPEFSYYNPEFMKPEDREKFLRWYEEHKGDHFDFQAELLGYCRSDMYSFWRCSLQFREDSIDVTGIDPFDCYITISSVYIFF